MINPCTYSLKINKYLFNIKPTFELHHIDYDINMYKSMHELLENFKSTGHYVNNISFTLCYTTNILDKSLINFIQPAELSNVYVS